MFILEIENTIENLISNECINFKNNLPKMKSILNKMFQYLFDANREVHRLTTERV